jgi:hypothetical protein
MTKTLFIFSALFVCLSGFSQRYDSDFIYGKMVRKNDTLKGYFMFSHEISQNGQPVSYKAEAESEKIKTFPSRRYDYFESDSLYLETFGVVPMLTGDVLIMIPRIVNGKLQLFTTVYSGGGVFNLGTTESFFIKKGIEKIKIKKSKFKKQMETLIQDDQALLQKIENDELKYEDIIEIVKTYDSNHS